MRSRGLGSGRVGVVAPLLLLMAAATMVIVPAEVLGTVLQEDPVAEAARAGDLEGVRRYVEAGLDVNAPLGDGMTALHWAARNGHAEMARLLLDAGANVSAGTRIGRYTPLHVAARAGHHEVVAAVLERGADPNARATTTGASPLHLAAEAGDVESIRLLVAKGADVDGRDDHWGHTPLFYAVNLNRVDAISALVAAGADVGATARVINVSEQAAVDELAQDRLHETLDGFRRALNVEGTWRPTAEQAQAAIEIARSVQAKGVAALEASAAAEADKEEGERTTPEIEEHPVGAWGGLTPLIHAARSGHFEATTALLDAGADIDQVSAGDGTSPLLAATINGHFDVAMTLLERGADPRIASHAGATPLYGAINLQWAPKTRYAQPRAHEFQEADYLTLMEALLEAGADPNVRLEKDLWYSWGGRDATGATPFWRAAYGTDVAAMRLLVAHGADPAIPTRAPEPRRPRNEPDSTETPELDPSGLPPVPPGGPGTYPIQAASGVGYGENYSEGNIHRHAPGGWLPSVRYLVEELGADVNSRDHNGYTALHHAAARGDVPLIQYLVEQGADVTLLSRRGQTTADMANSPGQRLPVHPEALALLESLGSQNNHNCAVC